MNNKIKLSFLFLFCFYFILFCLSPISGDDWGNYIVGSTGIYHSIGNAVGMYFSWEGRFISRVLINILTYHKFFWNLINSGIIVFLMYLIVKIIGFKNKNVYYLIFLIIPFMNIFMFSQTVTWIAGNLTYFFEIPFMFLYFILLYKGLYHKWWFGLCFVLSLFIPMFVEHMAIIIVLFNIFFIIYNYFVNKKFDFRLIIFTIISILSTCLMFFSPGTALRSGMENVEFNNLSLLGKVIFNIPSFVFYTFTSNYYLLILIVISSFYMVKNCIKKSIYKWSLFIFFTVIPLITIVLYFLSIVYNINIYSNLFIIIYYLALIVIYFILIIKEKSMYSGFFFVVGLLSNLVMLFSPTWGYRTGLFTYICLCISCIIIISKYLNNLRFLKYFYLFILSIYMVLYINVFICQKDLEKSIKEQLTNDVIYVVRFPSFINCNINPDNEYHLLRFKEYYGISSEKDVSFVENKWKFIFYNK